MKRKSDAIIYSCNRANESEKGGCEDVMNCACTVKVNCAEREHAHAVQL